MAKRINRAIELLEQDQPIYYVGHHTGHVLTYEQGKIDAKTWADYINVGMEHGSFNMAGLDEYMRGLIDGGPTNSGHRTPPIIVEPPVEGSSEAIIRFNAWQFRQILARGVHGLILCTAETPDAVRAFVESCRYPINMQGVGYGLDRGTRGTGSQRSSAPVWGVTSDEYVEKADPWPLNPDGELLLGVKIETVRALSNVEQTLTVPGIAFAEWGPGDLHMSFGIKRDRSKPLKPQLVEARTRVRDACKANGLAFLDSCTPENVNEKIDEGIRIVAGGREEIAKISRVYTKRKMPV
jgi:4-hydroxy-2-oxoheptanedioate aldolase